MLGFFCNLAGGGSLADTHSTRVGGARWGGGVPGNPAIKKTKKGPGVPAHPPNPLPWWRGDVPTLKNGLIWAPHDLNPVQGDGPIIQGHFEWGSWAK